MSSRMLHRCILSTRSASSHLRLASRGPMGSNSTSNTLASASSRFPAQRYGAAVLQTRHVHQTRRLPGSLKIIGMVVACCVGGAAISFLVQVSTGGTIPPHVWARKVDEHTRKEVEAALIEEFDKARHSAPDELDEALREAAFRVPHELARLNKDAPDFRLEDLGPMLDVKKTWYKMCKTFPSLAPSLDCVADTRVFLYFPSGAAKATAIFVAVNGELEYPITTWDLGANVDSIKRIFRATFAVGLVMASWESQHRIWARNHQAVIGRVGETERIPVIFNFREKAYGAMYYRRLGVILISMFTTPLSVRHLDRGISLH